MEDLTELVTKLGGLRVEVRAGGGVGDERGGEEVLVAESESSRVAGDSVHAYHGVAFEYEEGIVKGGRAADGGCELGVGLLLGWDVV